LIFCQIGLAPHHRNPNSNVGVSVVWGADVKKPVEQIVDAIKQNKKRCLYHKVMEAHSSTIENNSFFNS
jgi:hypothetical protein